MHLLLKVGLCFLHKNGGEKALATILDFNLEIALLARNAQTCGFLHSPVSLRHIHLKELTFAIACEPDTYMYPVAMLRRKCVAFYADNLY